MKTGKLALPLKKGIGQNFQIKFAKRFSNGLMNCTNSAEERLRRLAQS